MEYLVFQLQGFMAAWGDPAVGEYRGSVDTPGESALIGLLGAALGLRREEETAFAALQEGYRFAVGVLDPGQLLRDYHTTQTVSRSSLKNRPHNSRRDELNLPSEELHTILSTRDYRQNGAWLIAVAAQPCAPHTLETLAAALRAPRFVLYLGRKSCPPDAPLYPQILQSTSAFQALKDYLQGIPEDRKIIRLSWGDDMDMGEKPTLSVPRKDRLIRRKAWQFGDRMEHRKELPKEEATCIST